MSLQALLLRALESHEFWPVGASEPSVRSTSGLSRRRTAICSRTRSRDCSASISTTASRSVRSRCRRCAGVPRTFAESVCRSSRAARADEPRPPTDQRNGVAGARVHPWPGNVRELGNVMSASSIDHAGRDVDVQDLGFRVPIRASLFPSVAPPRGPAAVLEATRHPLPQRSRPEPYSSEIAPISGTSLEVPPSSNVAPTSKRRRTRDRPLLDVDALAGRALPGAARGRDHLRRPRARVSSSRSWRAPTTTNRAPPARSA